MKRRTGLVLGTFAAVAVLLTSCGKSNSDSFSNGLDGDWAFHSQMSSSFFVDGNPGYWRSESYSTLNNTKVHFDGKGNFTFETHNGTSTGTSAGTYKFNAGDSLITIVPDSAAFLNFCYMLGTITYVTGPGPTPVAPLIHTPGILHVEYRSKDSLSLEAIYLNPDYSNGDSIVVARTGFIKL